MILWALPPDCACDFSASSVRDKKLQIARVITDQGLAAGRAGDLGWEFKGGVFGSRGKRSL